MSFIEALIKKAQTQIGVCEEPKGSNKGPQVTTYQRRAGYTQPVPWCLCFLYWCVDEVCGDLEITNKLIRTGGCDELLAWARGKGLAHDTPQAGDFGLVMKSQNDAVHVFLVEKVEGSTLHTIEGNTNDDGSREGYEVCRRVRKVKASSVYVRVASVMPTDAASERYTLVGPDGKAIDTLEAIDGVAWAPVGKVAKALGLRVNGKITPIKDSDICWDGEDQSVVILHKDFPAQIQVKNGVSYATVRKLAGFLGWSIALNEGKHHIVIG
jgi:hypothetical protein